MIRYRAKQIVARARQQAVVIAAAASAAGLLLRDMLRRHRRLPGPGRGNVAREEHPALVVHDRYSEYASQGDAVMKRKTRFPVAVVDELIALVEPFASDARDERLQAAPAANSNAGRPRKLSLANAVTLVLEWVSSNRALDELGIDYGIRKPYETAWHLVRALLRALKPFLAFPTIETQKQLLASNLAGLFKGAIFALDSTPTFTGARAGDHAPKRGGAVRNTTAIVDLTGRVALAIPGYNGSCHDAVAFAGSDFYREIDSLLAPEAMILADSAYSSLKRVIVEKSNAVAESKSAASSSSSAQKQKRQAAEEPVRDFQRCRGVVERVFGCIKKLFPVVESWHGNDLDHQAQLVLLAVALYNLQLDRGLLRGSEIVRFAGSAD